MWSFQWVWCIQRFAKEPNENRFRWTQNQPRSPPEAARREPGDSDCRSHSRSRGASLAEPLPLKLVLDTVLKAKSGSRWLHQVVAATCGTDKIAMLKFAAIAVLVIAAVGAISSYTERYLTTTVAYAVMHDLRQTLYSHVQRLSLAFHDRKYTGDLITTRLTSDIDSIQSFVASRIAGCVGQ